VATATNNFSYVNEGTDKKPKWGYVGDVVGASLTLTFNTTQENALKDQEVNVYLAYLKSYQHMGTARVQCVAGCACKEYMLDAHHEDTTSQTYLAKLTATQHDQCMVRVMVQEATRSGQHKIKVGPGPWCRDCCCSAAVHSAACMCLPTNAKACLLSD
jgi:hypothetical protein